MTAHLIVTNTSILEEHTDLLRQNLWATQSPPAFDPTLDSLRITATGGTIAAVTTVTTVTTVTGITNFGGYAAQMEILAMDAMATQMKMDAFIS